MVNYEIDCTILDNIYDVEDYQITAKIITTPTESKLYGWDGLQWSTQGLNRVYTNINNQNEFDEFLERLYKLRDSKILFEVARELEPDQSYYFENERIYIYIESKENYVPKDDE